MKKTIFIFVLVFLCCMLYAESFVESSLGFAFLSAKETATVEGESITAKEKSSALTADVTAMIFSGESRFGADLGLSVLFPLSSSISGTEVDVDFFDCNFCPRIGLAWKTNLNKQLVMLSSAGYELMMNYDSENILGVTIRSFLLIHGIYAQDRFTYTMEEGISFNAGLSVYIPIIGTVRLSAAGQGSEKIRMTYSGIMINPFIGIDIKTR